MQLKGNGRNIQATEIPLQWMLSDIHKAENPNGSRQEYHEFRRFAIPVYGYSCPNARILEWLCHRMVEAEVSAEIGADKHEQSRTRTSHRCGFRPRCLETWVGTMYLMVSKVRNDGYIPFFITERKRSETTLIQVIQEAYVQGLSTRKIERLKERALKKPSLIVSDAYKGLVATIGACFPGTSWQRCKVHFMRNILVHAPQKEKEKFSSLLKGIWMTTEPAIARQRANELADAYRAKCPRAVDTLEEALEDTLTFLLFPQLDSKKVSSTTCWSG